MTLILRAVLKTGISFVAIFFREQVQRLNGIFGETLEIFFAQNLAGKTAPRAPSLPLRGEGGAQRRVGGWFDLLPWREKVARIASAIRAG